MYSQVSLVTQAPLDSIFNGPEVSLSNNVRVTTWSQAENSRNCITWKYRATFTRIAEVIVQEPNWTSQKAVPSQRSTEISLSLSLSFSTVYSLSFIVQLFPLSRSSSKCTAACEYTGFPRRLGSRVRLNTDVRLKSMWHRIKSYRFDFAG